MISCTDSDGTTSVFIADESVCLHDVGVEEGHLLCLCASHMTYMSLVDLILIHYKNPA